MADFAYGDAPKDAKGYSDEEGIDTSHTTWCYWRTGGGVTLADDGASASEAMKDAQGEPEKKARVPRAPKPKLNTDMLKASQPAWTLFVADQPGPSSLQASQPAWTLFVGGQPGPSSLYASLDALRCMPAWTLFVISDLQRLLEMYSRWQKRVFPHSQYDDFISKLEKLSGSNIMKMELRQLRTDLIKLVDDGFDDQGDEQAMDVGDDGVHADAQEDSDAEDVRVRDNGRATNVPEQHPPPAQGVAGGRSGNAAPPDDYDDEDEELIAMQADDHFEAAMDVMDELDFGDPEEDAPRPAVAAAAQKQPTPSARAHAKEPAPPEDDSLEDDELLELIFGADGPPSSQPHASSGVGQGDEDDMDDELLALAGVGPSGGGGSAPGLDLELTHSQTEAQEGRGLGKGRLNSGVGSGGGRGSQGTAGGSQAARLEYADLNDGGVNDQELLDLMDEDEEDQPAEDARATPPTQDGATQNGVTKRGRAMRLDDEDDE
eukprot:gene10460-8417_t